MEIIPPDLGSNEKTNDDITPYWVKAFGIIGVVLLLLFVILHLAGGGLGNHLP